MLSAKINRIIVIFVIIVAIVLALFIGFRLGFGFIATQNERAQAIESMQQASRRAEAMPEPSATDAEGNVVRPTTTAPDNEEKYKMPRHVKQDTPGAVEIFIEPGQDSKDIAEILLSKGVIDQTLPFVVMAELNGFDGRYQLGTHFVLKDMDYNEIMHNLALPPETTWITFPEGFSYIDIKRRLAEAGVNFDEAEMDRLVDSPSLFTQYSFVTNIPTDVEERIFALEGYLFPDTYQFDLNASEVDIIRTFLRNADRKITPEMKERASVLGMSLDKVLTLASIIQNESGVVAEQYKVSRVFHNRMNREMMMQSCATTNYLRQLNGQPKVWAATAADIALENPYNTYKYGGLPPGPICNPGVEAIQAALYPDTEEPNLLFFVAKGDGTNAFASTLAGHEANIEEYSGNWSNPRD